jgi:hypothetical protein
MLISNGELSGEVHSLAGVTDEVKAGTVKISTAKAISKM